MNRRLSSFLVLLIFGSILIGAPAFGEQPAAWSGRFSLFGMVQNAKYDDGSTRDFSELTSWFTFRSKDDGNDGLEFSFDVRASAYPSSEERDSRTSLYDAWIGTRMANGSVIVRAGQMWLNELGGLGQVGGLMAEYRTSGARGTPRFRMGLFGGMEPTIYDVDYVSGVTKGGVWAAYDAGTTSRRHVLGWVLIKDESLTERSVVTTTNFIPVGRTFLLYQSAQYDLSGPGGEGKGGLHYLFANARYVPTSRVELMGNYHRGRSINARMITQDILNGRAIDQQALDGYLFESVGGRITVQVMKNLRVYAGYASDRNNREDKASGRITAGLWTSNVAGSGVDLTVSDNHIERDSGTYDAWYLSLGRSFGPRLYLSADYSTSLSVVRIIDSTGAIIENRPETKRYGLNGVWNMSRHLSLMLNAEELKDTTSTDDRLQLGLTWRF